MGASKFDFLAVGKVMAMVSAFAFSACTPNDYSLENHDVMAENAAEAEKAEELMAESKKTVVSKNDTKKEKKAASREPASVRGNVYVVQIGAFKLKENAEKLHSKLQEAGFSVEMHSIDHSKNGLLHLVRFAPTENKAEAENMFEELKTKREDLHAQILRMPASH